MKKDKSKKMTDAQLCSFVNELGNDTILSSGDYISTNLDIFGDYNQDPYGDEEDGLSKYVSRDVADLVDSDETALARVFLGANVPVEFTPLNGGQAAVQEAEDINLLVKHLVDNVKNSYKVQIDWLKEILLSKVGGYVEYGIETVEKPEIRKFEGLSRQDIDILRMRLSEETGIISVSIEEEIEEAGNPVDGQTLQETFSIQATIVTETQQYFVRNVPWEDMRISKNAQTKDDADLFGKKFRKRKSDLIAEGFDEDLVKGLPVASEGDKSGNNQSNSDGDTTSGVKSQRYQDQGGYESGASSQWQNDKVEGTDDYVLVDFDGDGVLERRHVVKVGSKILTNEVFNHIPFAGCSAIQMPHNIVGLSRAELAQKQQRYNSVLTRNIFDNISDVNMGRVYADQLNVNMDDLTNVRKKGVVRTKGAPGNAVFPEQVMYNGDKTLQVIQYLGGKHSQATGVMDTNQGLSSDQLHEETATRFEGVKDQGLAKIELVARNIAEIGYKDLYEGMAYFARHFQDSEVEAMILGREMTFNPSSWRYDHAVKARVGTGAGDDEKTLQTLSGILQIQSNEIEQGGQLADSKTKYNVYKEIIRASGLHGVNNYFNDPSQPQELLFAQNEQMKGIIEQLEAQINQRNQIAEAEEVKGRINQETEVLKAQLKSQQTLRTDQLKNKEIELKKQLEMIKIAQNQQQYQGDQIVDLTKIEADLQAAGINTDVPGSAI
jgi:hypothetical protein